MVGLQNKPGSAGPGLSPGAATPFLTTSHLFPRKRSRAGQYGDVCPHGRPIVKRVALADLLREFGRL